MRTKESIAKDWIEAKLQFCMYDCSDGMHEAEKQEAAWEAITETDTRQMIKFIKKNLLEKYYESCRDIAGWECMSEDELVSGESLVCELPIKYKKKKK